MFQHILINIPNLPVILKALITWGFNISEELTNGLPQDLNLALGSLWLTGGTEFPHWVLPHQTSCRPLIKRFNVINYYKRKHIHIYPLGETKSLFIHWLLNSSVILKMILPQPFHFYFIRIYLVRRVCHLWIARRKKSNSPLLPRFPWPVETCLKPVRLT